MIFLTWLCISAVCDATYRKCFNWIVILGFLGVIISLALIPELHPIDISSKDGLFGFWLAFLILIVFYLFGVMGAGDVKFAAVLGAWVGWKLILPIWVLSCVFAVLHGVIVRSHLKYIFAPAINWRDGAEKNGKRFIPYVTYLSVATVIVLMLNK